MRRRTFLEATLLGSAALSLPDRAWGSPSVPQSSLDLDQVELTLPGRTKIASRCLLLVPRRMKPERLLVLCHGLGETVSEALGVRAWADRYGLLGAYDRLGAPPVRSIQTPSWLDDGGARRLNDSLSTAPFRGFAIACPFTPNVYKAPSTDRALELYAGWLGDVLLPDLRTRLGLGSERDRIAIDGVSLGGYVSLEVFLRRPDAFGAVGTVQGAFGVGLSDMYATRFERVFAKHGARPVRVATSSQDPFRKAAQRLADLLRDQRVDVTFSLTPGPHDQPWLRDVGSLELLFDYDRLFSRKPLLPQPTLP